jgi:hypothetical protein
VLHHTYQVNAAVVDDGLQAGYLRLWRRLQQNPKLLEDKTLAWVSKGLVFTALHTTRPDWQFRQHTAGDGERQLEHTFHSQQALFRAHSMETRQADLRLDLQRAIGQVADDILTHHKGKRVDHDLWALYGLTMLQVSASELSRLFSAREQSMQQAYRRVRARLQEALPHYAPMGASAPSRKHGREVLPRENIKAIRAANGDVPDPLHEAVKTLIAATNADTLRQDELALEGIRQGIAAQTQARAFGFPTWRMQRAYDRVHLMLAAQRDPTVRMRRPERRVKSVFTLTEATTAAVHQLALTLLEQPKSYEKLVALHAHINNLAISTTAKHFNIPISTLRFYARKIGEQLGTPTVPARQPQNTPVPTQ